MLLDDGSCCQKWVKPSPKGCNQSGWPREPPDLLDLSSPMARGLGRGDEDPVARELLEQRRRPAEVSGQHVDRIAGNPHRQVVRLVMTRVEPDQDSAARP